MVILLADFCGHARTVGLWNLRGRTRRRRRCAISLASDRYSCDEAFPAVGIERVHVHAVNAYAGSIRRSDNGAQHVPGIRIELRPLFEKDHNLSTGHLALSARQRQQAGERRHAVLILHNALRLLEGGQHDPRRVAIPGIDARARRICSGLRRGNQIFLRQFGGVVVVCHCVRRAFFGRGFDRFSQCHAVGSEALKKPETSADTEHGERESIGWNHLEHSAGDIVRVFRC